MAIGSDSGLARGFIPPRSLRVVEVTKNTVVRGQRVSAGEVIEVLEADARLLIGLKHAKDYVEPPKKRNVKKTPTNRMVSENELSDRDLSE